jgi:Tol biopolymer transport system component
MNSKLRFVVILALLGGPGVSSAGETERVSVASDGSEGGNDSYYPAISANGRYVAFQSKANNLVANDIKIGDDIFVHDRQIGITELVSVDSEGNQAPGSGGFSSDPSISADGRYVAFHSYGRLVDNAIGGTVYVRDRQTGTTELASVTPDGSPPNQNSLSPNISADGCCVVFISAARNLVVPNDTDSRWDVFVRDRVAGNTQKVTVAFDGGQANQSTIGFPVISANGRYVAFNSSATNLGGCPRTHL